MRLNKLLKAFGFRREEGLPGFVDRFSNLPANHQEAILDAASNEALTGSPPEQLAQTALNLWRSGKCVEALDYYNKAIALAPTDSTFLLNRGNLHFELGFISTALEDFERAMSGIPKLPEHVFVNYHLIQTLGEDSPVLQGVIERRRKKREQA
jgi:tetratricopeptide (TPR) repeat protein